MSQLFNRVCELTLGTKKFSSPPFSIEFEQTFALSAISATVIKLYNPNKDTIKMAEPKKTGKTYTYANCIMSAGYTDESGTCITGEVVSFAVTQSGTDRILELKVTDKTQKWATAQIMQTFENIRASQLIKKVLTDLNIDYRSQELGEDITYKKITVTTLTQLMNRIVKDTKSIYYFKNGVFEIRPISDSKKNSIYLLTPRTGLVGSVNKIPTGIKFKTLFLYKIQPLDVVKIESRDQSGYFKITKGKKIFSTFGEGESEFEAVAL